MPSNRSRRRNCRHSLLLCALSLPRAIAQQCYYPDGGETAGESVFQCSGSSVCCPQGWDCLSNGLCYNKAASYLGRYSCTDKSWGKSCPDFCLDNGSMGGDQAVLMCSDGSYCCDADRTSFNCCDNGSKRFSLPDGGIGKMTGGNLYTGTAKASPSSPASTTSSSQKTSPSSSPQTSSDSSSASSSSSESTSKSSNTPSPSTTTIVTSETSASVVTSNGKPISTSMTTRASTSTSTGSSTPTDDAAAAANNSSTSTSSGSKKPVIIGVAVGVPVAIALLLIPLIFFLYRRHRKHRLEKGERRREQVADAYAPVNDKDSYIDSPVTPEFANGASTFSPKHIRGPSEIDGRPYMAHPDIAELYGDPPMHGTPGAAATVGGRGYTRRAPGRRREYDPYLAPAELPTTRE